jgi:hypothetical protein
VTFLIIALVVYVPFGLINAVLTTAAPSMVSVGPGGQASMGVGAALFSVLGMLLLLIIFQPLCLAALTKNISSAYLGHNMTAADSYRSALPRLAPLILTQLLILLIFFAFAVVVGIFAYVMGPIGFTLGLLVVIIPVIIMGLWFYVVAPVVILEGSSGTAALARSRELMTGNLGKGFGLGLVLLLLGLVVGFILGAIVGFIPMLSPMIRVFLQNVISALILPITTAPIILLYYDLRIRKEAFDLQMLSAAMEQPATT